MKCPKCGGTGEMQICEMGFIGKDECDKCHGKGYLTNEEWFDTLSTEEKAKTIANATYSSAMMGVEITALPKEDEVRKWKMWLKQPHTS